MKPACLFLFLCGLSSLIVENPVCAQKGRTVIAGRITHPENNKVRMIHFCNYEDLTMPEATLASDNSFKLVFELPESKYLRLEHGSNVADFFVMPGDSVFLTFDMMNMDSTFNASGKHAPHYFYWREHYFFTKNGRGADVTPEIMAKKVDSSFAAKRQFFDNFAKKYEKQIDPAFVKHYEVAYTYRPLSKLYMFPFMYAQNHDIPFKDLQLPTNYYTPLDKAPINIVDNWNVLEYQNFVSEYINFSYTKLLERGGKSGDNYDACEVYEFGKILLDGKGKWETLAGRIDDDIRYNGSPSAFEAFRRFMMDCPNDFIKNKLKEAYKEVQIAGKGKVLPNFSAKNSKGEKVSLSDFKGKIVLLDIWSTNCGPCFYEMRHENTTKLKAHFKDNPNVVFLYICVDRSETYWKEVLGRESFANSGIHLFDNQLEKGNVMEQLGVKGFPTYFIIDKAGAVFESNPPRPSNPELIGYLEKALAE